MDKRVFNGRDVFERKISDSRTAKVVEQMSGPIETLVPDDAPGWIVARYEELVGYCSES